MKEYICGYVIEADGPNHAAILSVDPATSFAKESFTCVAYTDDITFIIGIIVGCLFGLIIFKIINIFSSLK